MREYINQSITGLASQFNVDEQFVRHYIYVSLIVIFALFCGVVFKKLIVPLLKRIIVKTSFKFDDYLKDKEVLKYLDVLVDGQYVDALHNPRLEWRGSENQRVIDVQKSLKNGEVTAWKSAS